MDTPESPAIVACVSDTCMLHVSSALGYQCLCIWEFSRICSDAHFVLLLHVSRFVRENLQRDQFLLAFVRASR